MTRSPDLSSLTIDADLLEVRILAEFVRAACRQADVAEPAALDIELALVEAANNVIVHGYAAPSCGNLRLDLSFKGGSVTAVLTDSGNRIPAEFFTPCRTADPLSESGRGSEIIRSCVDHVAYDSDAGINRLTLTKTF